MSKIYHLSFSVGPVQTFVAQARRTRDLWAGSWLLSYLTESALVAAEKCSGRAMIPYRADEHRGRVTAKDSAVGGMPNRFELEFDSDQAKQQAIAAAHDAKAAFLKAWDRIAQAVFDECFDESVLAAGAGTAEIWQRQVSGFWELTWVVGQPPSGESTIGRLAAMRKNLRNVSTAAEPGVKCSLMPTYQELSGHMGRKAGQRQNDFWDKVRNKGSLGGFDLAQTERLCAIALVKRLFPRLIESAIGDDISPDLKRVAWPSTAFISALPWLKELNGETRDLAAKFQASALAAGYGTSEREAARDAGVSWANADAPIWFASAIRNFEPDGSPTRQPASSDQQAERREVIRQLLDQQQQVYGAAGRDGNEASSPVPYYAIVLMDGDSMGHLLDELKNQGGPRVLSECLDSFATQVDTIVGHQGGRTVYAGGDDVLALVPAVHAQAVAHELRKAYQQSFADQGVAKEVATISAAVVYAHWRFPLRQVLRMAHQLLDDVAKDATGRDAIAQGVVQGSGLNAVWSVPWEVHLGATASQDNLPCVCFPDFVARFASNESEESPQPDFNASFLYLLRGRFGYLLGDGHERPGEFLRFGESEPTREVTETKASMDTAMLLRDLTHAEYRRRLGKSARCQLSAAETLPIIDRLMSLSRRWNRSTLREGDRQSVIYHCDANSFCFDGWRLARFVNQINAGKVGDHD